MQLAVNGEFPPDSDGTRDTEIAMGVADLGMHLVPDFGEQPRMFECDDCGKEFPHGNVVDLTQCPSCMEPDSLREITRDNGELEFSSRTCDACRSPLAGARFRFAILGEE